MSRVELGSKPTIKVDVTVHLIACLICEPDLAGARGFSVDGHFAAQRDGEGNLEVDGPSLCCCYRDVHLSEAARAVRKGDRIMTRDEAGESNFFASARVIIRLTHGPAKDRRKACLLVVGRSIGSTGRNVALVSRVHHRARRRPRR